MCKHCWGEESVHHKDFIQGAVDEKDFEEVDYTPRRKNKKSKKKNYPGCPGNNRGSHVFVYTTERNGDDLFFRFFGYYKYERQICAGCGHYNGKRLSERYAKVKEREWQKTHRRGPFKYFCWEDYHPEYKVYYKNYIQRHGYTPLVWNVDFWF